MAKKYLWFMVGLLISMSLAGCGGERTAYHTFKVENRDVKDLEELWVAPVDDEYWGDELLAGDVIKRGGSYIYKVHDCDRNYNFRVKTGGMFGGDYDVPMRCGERTVWVWRGWGGGRGSFQ